MNFYNWYKRIYMKGMDKDIGINKHSSNEKTLEYFIENIENNNGFEKVNYLVNGYITYLQKNKGKKFSMVEKYGPKYGVCQYCGDFQDEELEYNITLKEWVCPDCDDHVFMCDTCKNIGSSPEQICWFCDK